MDSSWIQATLRLLRHESLDPLGLEFVFHAFGRTFIGIDGSPEPSLRKCVLPIGVGHCKETVGKALNLRNIKHIYVWYSCAIHCLLKQEYHSTLICLAVFQRGK